MYHAMTECSICDELIDICDKHGRRCPQTWCSDCGPDLPECRQLPLQTDSSTFDNEIALA